MILLSPRPLRPGSVIMVIGTLPFFRGGGGKRYYKTVEGLQFFCLFLRLVRPSCPLITFGIILLKIMLRAIVNISNTINIVVSINKEIHAFC